MPSKASTATRAMGMSGAPVKMAQFYPMSAIGSIVPRRVGQQHGPSPSTETKSMSKRTVLVVDLQNDRSEEHTSELQSLMRISYAVFCLKKKTKKNNIYTSIQKNYNNTCSTHHKQNKRYITSK